jgi:hypothetical protein
VYKDVKHVALTICYFGSKEETFFDSKGWLDSDSDSDFQSVSGDFTPYRGSTPVHHKFSTGSPKVNKPGQTVVSCLLTVGLTFLFTCILKHHMDTHIFQKTLELF